MLLTLANEVLGACSSRCGREIPMTIECKVVRGLLLFFSLAGCVTVGSLFRRLRNAVRHHDEPIASRQLESMSICRTRQNTLRFVLQVHRNEEKDIMEMVRITRTASKRVYYIIARDILWLYSTYSGRCDHTAAPHRCRQ